MLDVSTEGTVAACRSAWSLRLEALRPDRATAYDVTRYQQQLAVISHDDKSAQR
jgi:hypothetical protein